MDLRSRIVHGWETQTRGMVRWSLRLLPLLLAALAVDALGLGRSLDAQLRESWYRVRGVRASSQKVVLIAVDDETLRKQGALPWSEERWAALLGPLQQGTPSLIVPVDAALRLDMLASPPKVAKAAIEAGHLLWPLPLVEGEGQDLRLVSVVDPALGAALPRGAALERRWVQRVAPAHANVDSAELRVNYVGATGLPIVSAARVLEGDVPPGAFGGKILVIGTARTSFAEPHSTAVGELTVSEIKAHALSALADGAVWHELPAFGRLAFLALLLVLAVIRQRFGNKPLRVWVVGLGALWLLADFALFASGTALLGSAGAFVALLGLAGLEVFDERRALRQTLATLERAVRVRSQTGAKPPSSIDLFWSRVDEHAQLYVGCSKTLLLCPSGSPRGSEGPETHLEVALLGGLQPTDIALHRHVLDAFPYSQAHLTLKPVWHETLLVPHLRLKTLLVPLVSSGELLGFWGLSFPNARSLKDSDYERIQLLARQMVAPLRSHLTVRAMAHNSNTVGPVPVASGQADLEERVQALAGDGPKLANVLDALPYGALVSTVLGEVQHINAALLAAMPRGGGQAHSLAQVLGQLSSLHPEDLQEAARRLLGDASSVRLTGRPDIHTGLDTELVLSWLGSESGDGAGRGLLLLCVVPGDRREDPIELPKTVSVLRPPVQDRQGPSPRRASVELREEEGKTDVWSRAVLGSK